jgi:hypothetical protein
MSVDRRGSETRPAAASAHSTEDGDGCRNHQRRQHKHENAYASEVFGHDLGSPRVVGQRGLAARQPTVSLWSTPQTLPCSDADNIGAATPSHTC